MLALRTLHATQLEAQSSTRSRGTRENSAALCVTTVRSYASLIDAINRSCSPIGRRRSNPRVVLRGATIESHDLEGRQDRCPRLTLGSGSALFSAPYHIRQR